MTKFNLTNKLAAAAAALALSIAVSGSALAHGMGGTMGGNTGNGLGHITGSNLTGSTKLLTLSGHDGRRLRFIRFGLYPSGCVYRWTEFGRVRICPEY
jgi:hypothetical protein